MGPVGVDELHDRVLMLQDIELEESPHPLPSRMAGRHERAVREIIRPHLEVVDVDFPTDGFRVRSGSDTVVGFTLLYFAGDVVHHLDVEQVITRVQPRIFADRRGRERELLEVPPLHRVVTGTTLDDDLEARGDRLDLVLRTAEDLNGHRRVQDGLHTDGDVAVQNEAGDVVRHLHVEHVYAGHQTHDFSSRSGADDVAVVGPPVAEVAGSVRHDHPNLAGDRFGQVLRSAVRSNRHRNDGIVLAGQGGNRHARLSRMAFGIHDGNRETAGAGFGKSEPDAFRRGDDVVTLVPCVGEGVNAADDIDVQRAVECNPDSACRSRGIDGQRNRLAGVHADRHVLEGGTVAGAIVQENGESVRAIGQVGVGGEQALREHGALVEPAVTVVPVAAGPVCFEIGLVADREAEGIQRQCGKFARSAGTDGTVDGNLVAVGIGNRTSHRVVSGQFSQERDGRLGVHRAVDDDVERVRQLAPPANERDRRLERRRQAVRRDDHHALERAVGFDCLLAGRDGQLAGDQGVRIDDPEFEVPGAGFGRRKHGVRTGRVELAVLVDCGTVGLADHGSPQRGGFHVREKQVERRSVERRAVLGKDGDLRCHQISLALATCEHETEGYYRKQCGDSLHLVDLLQTEVVVDAGGDGRLDRAIRAEAIEEHETGRDVAQDVSLGNRETPVEAVAVLEVLAERLHAFGSVEDSCGQTEPRFVAVEMHRVQAEQLLFDGLLG